MELNEFKQQQKHVDSINKTLKIPIRITIEIVDSSYLEEDKGKRILLGVIKERYPYNSRIVYIIKFDKNRKTIVLIKKEESRFEQPDLIKPQDIQLPHKRNS